MNDSVQLGDGSVIGTSRDGIRRFCAIPYAAPPLGDLRFCRPQAAAPLGARFDATEFGPQCVQIASFMTPPNQAESEDCLTLNVWAPTEGTNLPVMVWIHGGSFTSGSGSLAWYHGEHLAARGVVVVTLNYRLGALGFAYLAGVDESLHEAVNLGLADQTAALEWVRDNIASFGGDPKRVTLFGESAGAMSVSAHLVRPASKGLFHRAIVQSGAIGHSQSTDSATDVALAVLESVGTQDAAALRELPATAFVDADGAASARVFGSALPLAFQPARDGVDLPDDPTAALAAGVASDIPLMVGTNEHEMRLFTFAAALSGHALDNETLLRRTRRLLSATGSPADGAEVVECYRSLYPGSSALEIWAAIATDSVFRLPAVEMLAAHNRGGGEAWQYSFAVQSSAFDGALGAAHALEIPFVFDNLAQPGVHQLLGPTTTERSALATSMCDTWARFAYGDAPRFADGTAWVPSGPSAREVSVLGIPCETRTDFLDDVRDVWRRGDR